MHNFNHFVNSAWMKSGKEPADHAAPVMTNQSEPEGDKVINGQNK